MGTHPSVLVIDDEPDNFDVVDTLLHHEGYQLHYSASGQKALEQLQTFQPDAILLDVMMPDLDGVEVCQRIKAQPQWQAIPIIMVTALSAKEDLARCLAAGADDFISKPVHGAELRARVRSMLRIKQQYDDLQALLRLREDMVNSIVHDLRNPLTSILLETEFLKLPGLSPTKRQIRLENLSVSGQRLQSMIDSLLLMAKLESGKMVLNRQSVDLCTLCSSAIADLGAIAAEKNLRLVSQFPTTHNSIPVDTIIFRRVLDNLLANAIKFSVQGSPIVVEVEYLEGGGAIVQVADSGPGIGEDLRQVVFEKYEVGTRMKEVSQIGLGLAFCKMAIEAHRGQIAIEENEPQGSIFKIILPE